MRKEKVKVTVLLFCLLSLLALAQAPPKRESRAAVSAEEQQEAQNLANDIARMRSLLRQMEMNLALVQTTQTPLKHQFELDLDMWRLMLEQMERRAQQLRPGTTGGVVSPGTVPLRQDSRQEKP